MSFPFLPRKLLFVVLTFLLPVGNSEAWQPLRAHPQNPHILEFRGEPTVLRTFAEHYSAVINEDFEFIPYLDNLKKDGINLTRVFLAGFRVDEGAPTMDPLGPPAARFLQPWPRANAGANALDGLRRWDFTQWNESYFDRLRNFLDACSERDIAVELTFFCTFYTELQWRASPFNPLNNVQGYGPVNRYDSMRPVNADLYAIQKAFVTRVIQDLNGYDHIYYEIQNEPFWNQPGVRDGEEVVFHNELLGLIRNTEAALPQRHMVAHNFPQQAAAISADFDVINAHYPKPVPNTPIIGGEALLRDFYQTDRILALDETDTQNSTQLRLEAWMFLAGGGGIYNGLDYVNLIYTSADEAGNSPAGQAKRAAVRNVGRYFEDLHLVSLRRNLSWVSAGIPAGAKLQAMASPGQQYVAYFHHGGTGGAWALSYDPIDNLAKSIAPTVTLAPGRWRAVWSRPEDLVELGVQEFTHAGGSRTLTAVSYARDIVLRIDRIGEGDLTPPPGPGGLSAIAAANGTINLSWQESQAVDLENYYLYRSTGPDGIVALGNRISIIPSTATSFTDADTNQGETYYYVVTAVDTAGNESAARRSATATAQLRNVPFGGNARMIPGLILAEDFDEGGQHVAYFDSTSGNLGGQYRTTEWVDIEATTDEISDHHVTGTETGEWLKYSVKVSNSGPYTYEMRVASPSEGGAVFLEVDGVDVTGIIPIPATGGVDVWQTVSVPGIPLIAGERVLRLVMAGQAPDAIVGSFNWLKFTSETRIGPTADAGPDQEITDGDDNGMEAVTLDGRGSTEGDSGISTYEWILNGSVIATGVSASVSLPDGANGIELRVTDANGLESVDTVVVRIRAAGLVNGSFESGLSGWVVFGNHGLQSSLPYVPTEGRYLMSFNNANSSPNAMLSQTFPTVPGRTYAISFDYGNLSYNTQVQRLEVEVLGSSILYNQIFSTTGLAGGKIRWQAASFAFVANSASSTLHFYDRSATTSNIDLVLDNVKLIPRITRRLSVQSVHGIAPLVTVSPADDSGQAGGVTDFERSYPNATVVSLSAPSNSGGYRFEKWVLNGQDAGNASSIEVVMNADHSLVAMYVEGEPSITLQPQGRNVRTGEEVRFEVAAVGPGGLSYQWRFNEVDIPDATGNVLIIAEVAEASFGNYDVVVSNAAGSTTSEVAVLGRLSVSLVNGGFEMDLVGWMSSGNLAVRTGAPYVPSEGVRTVAFNRGNSVPNGILWQAFESAPGQRYRLTMDTGVLAYNTSEQRIQVEIKGNALLGSQTYVMKGIGGGSNRWFSRSVDFTADSNTTTITFRDRSTTSYLIDLLLDHVKVTPLITRILTVESTIPGGVEISASPQDALGRSGGMTPFVRSYQDLALVTLIAPASHVGYEFSKWTRNGLDLTINRTVQIAMDADARVSAVYTEAVPVITSQPSSVTTTAGSSATFRVVATGLGDLSYQWRRNGEIIGGATSEAFEIVSVGPEHVGIYDVIVSNAAGPVTSAPADLAIGSVGLVNGSFENGYEGWSKSGNSSVQTSFSYQNTDGAKLIAFNGGNSVPNGILAQSFTTAPGANYVLSFDVGVLAYNKLQQRMQADINGLALLRTQTVSIAGLGSGLTRWQTVNLAFTADSGSTTITFRDRSTTTSAIDLLLDHVRLLPQGVAIQQASRLAVGQESGSTVQPVAPSLVKVPDGFRISIRADVPGKYTLQQSEDLGKWTEVSKFLVSESRELGFTDRDSSKERMFYRFVIPKEAGGN